MSSDHLIFLNPDLSTSCRDQEKERIFYFDEGLGMREDDEIVLIEDDEDKAYTIISILKKHLSGTIRHFEDGETAMNFLFSEESRGTKLILLDLILPKIDGVEILRRIKADPLKEKIPVIILTSSSQTQTYLDSLGLHPDGYVNKPSAFLKSA